LHVVNSRRTLRAVHAIDDNKTLLDDSAHCSKTCVIPENYHTFPESRYSSSHIDCIDFQIAMGPSPYAHLGCARLRQTKLQTPRGMDFAPLLQLHKHRPRTPRKIFLRRADSEAEFAREIR
jgi:hypothetical protein